MMLPQAFVLVVEVQNTRLGMAGSRSGKIAWEFNGQQDLRQICIDCSTLT